MSVKVIAECDRCGYQEDFTKDTPRLTIPERWQHFGICPKYLLCPTCSSSLRSKLDGLTYEFVRNPKKDIMIAVKER